MCVDIMSFNQEQDEYSVNTWNGFEGPKLEIQHNRNKVDLEFPDILSYSNRKFSFYAGRKMPSISLNMIIVYHGPKYHSS